VIGHPFNPPHLVPLVEVVAGNDTAPATVERALAFYAAIGKRPIRIHREVAGHVANRLQAALWREAVHLVTEGVAHGGRHRHRDQRRAGHALGLEGPYLTFHLAGGSGGIGHFLDQFAGPMEAWWETLG
jgi:3-hydroxyacyl-CoA dehydrogenase